MVARLSPKQLALAARLVPLVRPAVLLEARSWTLDAESESDPDPMPASSPAGTSGGFGGHPSGVKGEPWPVCSSCAVPMSFVVQFAAPGTGDLLVFYYCQECFAQGDDESERGTWLIRRHENAMVGTLVALPPPADTEVAKRSKPLLPTAQRVIKTLPCWEGLAELEAFGDVNDDDYKAAIQHLDCFGDLATLIGGHPQYLQGRVWKHCAKCGKTMDFIAQIDSFDAEEGSGVCWVSGALMYLFQCPAHPDQFGLFLQAM